MKKKLTRRNFLKALAVNVACLVTKATAGDVTKQLDAGLPVITEQPIKVTPVLTAAQKTRIAEDLFGQAGRSVMVPMLSFPRALIDTDGTELTGATSYSLSGPFTGTISSWGWTCPTCGHYNQWLMHLYQECGAVRDTDDEEEDEDA